MTLVNTADLIDSQGWVLAANVILLEQAEAYAMAAESLGQGLVMQLSENTVDYHGSLKPIGRALIALADESSQPISVHLDHATRSDLVAQAVDLGFQSVMFDASKLEYAENVSATAELRSQIGPKVWLEAELGEVGGKNGVHSPGARTNPQEASEFVAATGVDALAVAVGSSHAMTTKSAELDLDLIAQLSQAVPVPLVLHGSSGVSVEMLRGAVAAGIKKINIATELNVAFNSSLAENLSAGTSDPRKFLAPAKIALSQHVAELMRILGD